MEQIPKTVATATLTNPSLQQQSSRVHMFPVTPPDDSNEEIAMIRTLRPHTLVADARIGYTLEKPSLQDAKLNSQTLREMPASLRHSINKTKVEYRNLGNSGLRISNPILGCMHFGSSKWLDWVLDEAEAVALLKEAYDRGINTVSLFRSVCATSRQVWLICKTVGYGKRLFQRRVGVRHQTSAEDSWYSKTQGGDYDQVL
jgi:hypothetical protein